MNQKSYLRKISNFEGRILESVSNMEVVARRPSPLARCPSFISPVFVLRRHRRCLWWHLWWLSSSIAIVTVVVRGTSSIARHPSAPSVVVAVRRRPCRCLSSVAWRTSSSSSSVVWRLSSVVRRPSHIARRTSSIVCPPWLARRPSLVASVRPPRRPSRFRRPSFVRPPRRVRRRRRRHRYLSVRPLVVAVLCPSVPSVLRHKTSCETSEHLTRHSPKSVRSPPMTCTCTKRSCALRPTALVRRGAGTVQVCTEANTTIGVNARGPPVPAALTCRDNHSQPRT